MASVARVTEISSRSEQSFEDAVKVGLERAHKTLRGVKSAGSRSSASTSRTAGSSAIRSTCW